MLPSAGEDTELQAMIQKFEMDDMRLSFGDATMTDIQVIERLVLGAEGLRQKYGTTDLDEFADCSLVHTHGRAQASVNDRSASMALLHEAT